MPTLPYRSKLAPRPRRQRKPVKVIPAISRSEERARQQRLIYIAILMVAVSVLLFAMAVDQSQQRLTPAP